MSEVTGNDPNALRMWQINYDVSVGVGLSTFKDHSLHKAHEQLINGLHKQGILERNGDVIDNKTYSKAELKTYITEMDKFLDKAEALYKGKELPGGLADAHKKLQELADKNHISMDSPKGNKLASVDNESDNNLALNIKPIGFNS